MTVAVTVAWALWPDGPSVTSLLSLWLSCLVFAAVMPTRAFAYMMITFVISAAGAFLLLSATSTVGHFVTDYQEPLVSDSQFFLYCAQEFSKAPSLEGLLTTWGSLAPVLFGGLALWLFHGAYLGIVLLNSAMYAFSIHITLLQLERHEDELVTAGALACALPLQAFYDSMLAKEPIYLLLTSISVYLISRVQRRHAVRSSISLLILPLLLLLFLRPVGSLLLVVVAAWALFRTNQRKVLLFFAAGAFVVTVSAFAVTAWTGVPIPLYFINTEGSFSLESQVEFLSRAAGDKAGVGNWIPLFTPPLSLLLSPVLAIIWLVAPFPAFGPFFDSLTNCLSLNFSFRDLALVARGADSVIMLLLLGKVLLARSDFGLRWQDLDRPVFLFTVLSVLAISAFQFIESGRHRYGVTPVLLLFAWSVSRGVQLNAHGNDIRQEPC